MKKSRIQLGFIIILIIMAASLLLSQNANPDQELLFGLKRIQEKVFSKTKTAPQAKVDYMSSILESRLEELQNVVKNKNYGYVLPAASRYSTLVGQITEIIIVNNLLEKKEFIKNKFLSHQKILNKLYEVYPKNTDNIEYKYIKDDINYLDLYLDKLAIIK